MGIKTSDSLKKRFSGAEGRERLIECLSGNRIISGNKKIATLFADHGEILEFTDKSTIIVQSGSDNDIYFLLTGSIDIYVNNRKLSTRMAGDCFGEMAVIDSTTVRSATVTAKENVTVLKVEQIAFSKITKDKPDVWRRLCSEIASRLRERNKYFPAPNRNPIIFIGSSSEGLLIANKIDKTLKKMTLETKLWSENVFSLSMTTIESLIQASKICDFAVLIMGPDDRTASRGSLKPSPRDNVILELGLFIGSIGRDRTYILAPKNVNIKIPTDLLGVTYLTYKTENSGISPKELKMVTSIIQNKINEMGPK